MNVMNDHRSNIDYIMAQPSDYRPLFCISCSQPGHLHCLLSRVPYGDTIFQKTEQPVSYVPENGYVPPVAHQPQDRQYRERQPQYPRERER